jgi:hypothetical protein
MAGRRIIITYVINGLMGQSIKHIMSWFKRFVNFVQQTCFESRITLFPITLHIFTILRNGHISIYLVDYSFNIWSIRFISREPTLGILALSLCCWVSAQLIHKHRPYARFCSVLVWKGIRWQCKHRDVTGNDDDVIGSISHLALFLSSRWRQHTEWRNEHENSVQRWRHCWTWNKNVRRN